MDWVAIILAVINEAPEIGKLIAGYQSSGASPTVDQVSADLAALGVSDDYLKAAYQRAFPGQAYPDDTTA